MLNRGTCPENARVVHQPVQSSPLFLDCCAQPVLIGAGGAFEIERKDGRRGSPSGTNLVIDRLEMADGPTEKDDSCAEFGTCFRQGAADARSSPRDENDPVLHGAR